MDSPTSLPITVEFSGGLEMLFSNQRTHKLSLPDAAAGGGSDGSKSAPTTIAYLVQYLCDHIMKDARKEMFLIDGHVRPGILVLINDADWELEGEEAYQIQAGDTIMFVSTLHGG